MTNHGFSNEQESPYFCTRVAKITSDEPDDFLAIENDTRNLKAFKEQIRQKSQGLHEILDQKKERVKKISKIVAKKASNMATQRIQLIIRKKQIKPYYGGLSTIGQLIQNELPKTPFQEWLPPQGTLIKKILVAFHGFGGHSSWLKSLQELTNAGIAVYAKDLRGFGKNNSTHSDRIKTPKGHVRSFNLWLKEIAIFCRVVDKYYPEAEQVCLGNSLGGVLLFLASARYKNLGDKYILMVPGFAAAGGTHVTVGGKKIFYLPGLRRVHGSYNFPYIFRITSKIGLSYLQKSRQYIELIGNINRTEEEAVYELLESQKANSNNELDTMAVTPWLMWQVALATKKAYAWANKARGPILVVTSGREENALHDGIVCCETIRDMFNRLPVTEKKLIHHTGPHDLLYFHELYANQKGAGGRNIMEIIQDWTFNPFEE